MKGSAGETPSIVMAECPRRSSVPRRHLARFWSPGRHLRFIPWREHLASQRGVSIVETQLAIAFMGVTLLAFAQMVTYSHLAIAKGGSVTLDTARARLTMESVRMAPLGAPVCPAERAGVGCTVEVVSTGTVGERHLPNNLYRITVTTPTVKLESMRATNLENQ